MEGFLDIYDSSSFVKKYSLKGNSGYITQFDWSTDSKNIASNYSEGELLYFNLENGTKISDVDHFKNINWATNSRLYAWDIQGIWSKYKTDIQPRNIDLLNQDIQGVKIISVGYDDGSFSVYRYKIYFSCFIYKIFIFI